MSYTVVVDVVLSDAMISSTVLSFLSGPSFSSFTDGFSDLPDLPDLLDFTEAAFRPET